MTDRDEVFDLSRIISANSSATIGESDTAAQAVLAAGYRKPRTITTEEEAAALPEGAVIQSLEQGYVFELATTIRNKAYGYSFGEETGSFIDDSYLPATVLYIPEVKP